MSSIENQIAYFPDSRINKSTLVQLGDQPQFSGMPCPTKETIRLIGKEGVEYIDQLMKQVAYYRAMIFGKNSLDSPYIFPSINRIIHIPSRSFIEVVDPHYVMEHDVSDLNQLERGEKGLFWKHFMQKNSSWFKSPELMNSDNFYLIMSNTHSKVSLKMNELLELVENTKRIMPLIHTKS